MAASGKVSLTDRRATLESRLAELKARLVSIEQELDSHVERDWEEAATEREGDEVLEAEGVSGLQEIRMIEAALTRLDEDEYGHCTRCGAEIAEGRLDVLPYTPFCAACAR